MERCSVNVQAVDSPLTGVFIRFQKFSKKAKKAQSSLREIPDRKEFTAGQRARNYQIEGSALDARVDNGFSRGVSKPSSMTLCVPACLWACPADSASLYNFEHAVPRTRNIVMIHDPRRPFQRLSPKWGPGGCPPPSPTCHWTAHAHSFRFPTTGCLGFF